MKAKSIESLPLSILHAFYKQTMSMALQHAQAISILKSTIVIGKSSSRLGVLLSEGLPFLI